MKLSKSLVLRFAVGDDPVPVAIDHVGEFLVRFQSICAARRFSKKRRAQPSRSELQSWPKGSLSR